MHDHEIMAQALRDRGWTAEAHDDPPRVIVNPYLDGKLHIPQEPGDRSPTLVLYLDGGDDPLCPEGANWLIDHLLEEGRLVR